MRKTVIELSKYLIIDESFPSGLVWRITETGTKIQRGKMVGSQSAYGSKKTGEVIKRERRFAFKLHGIRYDCQRVIYAIKNNIEYDKVPLLTFRFNPMGEIKETNDTENGFRLRSNKYIHKRNDCNRWSVSLPLIGESKNKHIGLFRTEKEAREAARNAIENRSEFQHIKEIESKQS